MSLNVEKLLAPIAADAPCGENLEYDADFAAMELAATGKPEQQFGSTVIPAEEPEWKEVRAQAVDLLTRSKDLRTALYLVKASAALDGLPGLADGIAVLAGLVEKYWDGVHPQLDPDDDNDPTLRMNTVAGLNDPLSMLRTVRDATLVRSRALGKYAYRDVLVASGELPPPAGTEKVDGAAIDGAFADCDAAELKATAAAVKQALAGVRSLDDTLTRQVGAGAAPQLNGLIDLLSAMAKLLDQKLAARGLSGNDEPAAEEATDETAADTTSAAASAGDGQSTAAVSNGRKASGPMSLSGDISSRDDVIRALDKICEYYKRYEPSSPVPLFLNRAKRLASKSFLEILRDLTPDAVNQALAIGGIGEEGGGVDPNDI